MEGKGDDTGKLLLLYIYMDIKMNREKWNYLWNKVITLPITKVKLNEIINKEFN